MELDSKQQHKYFQRFAKKWNRGKLDNSYYNGSLFSAEQSADEEVSKNGQSISRNISSLTSGPADYGPSRPSYDDLSMQRETELDQSAADRDAMRRERKKENREARQEQQADRATGRDRLQEKRAERRESNRAMAQSREQGDMVFGEDFLLGGGGSSFQDAIRRRDAARRNSKRGREALEKKAVLDDKKAELRQKEDSTMAMVGIRLSARLSIAKWKDFTV